MTTKNNVEVKLGGNSNVPALSTFKKRGRPQLSQAEKDWRLLSVAAMIESSTPHKWRYQFGHAAATVMIKVLGKKYQELLEPLGFNHVEEHSGPIRGVDTLTYSMKYKVTRAWTRGNSEAIGDLQSRVIGHLATGWAPPSPKGSIKYQTPISAQQYANMQAALKSGMFKREVLSTYEKNILLILLLQVKEGFITEWHTGHKCGRNFVNGIGMQNAPNRVRSIILQGTGAEDNDQKAACAVIALNEMGLSDEDRANILGRDKMERLKLCFGGIPNDGDEVGWRLHNKINPLRLHGDHLKDLRKKHAYRIFAIERRIQDNIESIIRKMGIDVYVSIHDGCITSRPLTSVERDSLNRQMRDTTGYIEFELVSKKVWK